LKPYREICLELLNFLAAKHKNFEKFIYDYGNNVCFVGKGKNMKLLGVVRGTNPKGDLIVKSDGPAYVHVGAEVFDTRKRTVGRVKKLFGPVKAPYINIKPKKQRASSELFGTEVYFGAREES